MSWLKKKAAAVFERLETCPRCSHNAPTGVPGCGCTGRDCACA